MDAVDVGHGQLAEALSDDPRVTSREGVNVRELRAGDVTAPPAIVVADLSFISLTLVLASLAAVVAPEAQMLVLVKPQFEVGRSASGRAAWWSRTCCARRPCSRSRARCPIRSRSAPCCLPAPRAVREPGGVLHLVDRAGAHRRVDLTGDLEAAVERAVHGRPALVRPVRHGPPRRLA